MAYLTDKQIASMRATMVDVAMPDLMAVLRASTASTAGSEDAGVTVTIAEDVPCRLAMLAMTRADIEAMEGEAVQARKWCTVHAPAGQDVQPADRLRITRQADGGIVEVEVVSRDFTQGYNIHDSYNGIIFNSGEGI